MADQLRTCLACGREAPRDLLLRLVVAPDGRVLPDVLGRAPGRGLWVCPAAACVEGLAKAPRFRKAIAGHAAAIDAPSVLAAALDQIAARVTSLLLLARKAGKAAIGTDEALERSRGGGAALVAVACDAAGKSGDFSGAAVIRLGRIDKRRLGALLGGTGECAAVAVDDAGLGGSLRHELIRLDGIAPGGSGKES